MPKNGFDTLSLYVISDHEIMNFRVASDFSGLVFMSLSIQKFIKKRSIKNVDFDAKGVPKWSRNQYQKS